MTKAGGRFRPFVLLLVLVSGAVALEHTADAQATGRRGAPPGAALITDSQLRDYLSFIAADELEGRLTPSPGLDAAATFLASHLARFGLRPAGGNGTFLQPIALTRTRLDAEHTALSIGSRTLALGDDYLPGDTYGTAEGRAIYVGNGTVIRRRGIDPYRDLDVRSKIVISNTGLPAGLTDRDLHGARGIDWERTVEAAHARGAIGVLFLPDHALQSQWTSARDQRQSRNRVTVDAFDESPPPSLPTATLSQQAARVLFAGEPASSEIVEQAIRGEAARPFELSPQATVRLSVQALEERLTTSNVVAVLDGGDTTLAGEYVAIGAHYDHLGTSETPGPGGDVIYNGADDDGSGTAGMLAMAEAFAGTQSRPKRSILFVWHTGEEQGLWGSRYFTAHPTVPLDRIVAQLNIDMIGRGRRPDEPAGGELALTGMDSVYVVGSRRMSPALGTLIAQVNATYLRLHYDYSLDEAGNPGQIYERSDHYEYARRGIPIAFFFTGVHQDYHGVDDEIDRIDFAKLRRIVQTIYATARAIADDPRLSRAGSPAPLEP